MDIQTHCGYTYFKKLNYQPSVNNLGQFWLSKKSFLKHLTKVVPGTKSDDFETSNEFKTKTFVIDHNFNILKIRHTEDDFDWHM